MFKIVGLECGCEATIDVPSGQPIPETLECVLCDMVVPVVAMGRIRPWRGVKKQDRVR